MKISELLRCEPIEVITNFYYEKVSLTDMLGSEAADIYLDEAVLKRIFAGYEVRVYADNSSYGDQGTLVLGALFKGNAPITAFETGGSWADGDLYILDRDAAWNLLGKLKAAEAERHAERPYDPWNDDTEIEYVLRKGVEIIDNKIVLFDPHTDKRTAPKLSRQWVEEMWERVMRGRFPGQKHDLPEDPKLFMSALSTVSAKAVDWSAERVAVGLPAVASEDEFNQLWKEAVTLKG